MDDQQRTDGTRKVLNCSFVFAQGCASVYSPPLAASLPLYPRSLPSLVHYLFFKKGDLVSGFPCRMVMPATPSFDTPSLTKTNSSMVNAWRSKPERHARPSGHRGTGIPSIIKACCHFGSRSCPTRGLPICLTFESSLIHRFCRHCHRGVR